MPSTDSHTTDASQWVVDQIQVELDDALAKLERYIKRSEEIEQLQECAEVLKNTGNVCLMAGMDAQALLSAELCNLSNQHLEQPEKNTEQILGILSEGVVTLRAFLDTAGGDAIFIKLTPPVNNIRALIEQPLASESDLFQPDIISGLQSFSRTFSATLDSAVLRKIRTLYQRSALVLMRDGLPDTTLNELQKVFKLLYQRGGTAYLSAIAFTCLALLEKISAGDLKFELALRQQFKRVDEVLKKLIAGGDHEDSGLLKNLLFYLAISGGDQAAGTRTLKFFKLEKFAQTALEINTGSLNLVDARSLEPVVEALSADIAQANTALEDALTGQLDFGETKRLLNILITRMGDTLAMVGIEDAQTTAAEVSNVVRSWKSIDTIEEISDEDLSLVTDALVRLEVRLKSLTSSHSSDSIENIDSASEVGDARQTLLDQGRISVERSKADINDYMSRDFDSHALEKVPIYLTELEGALRFYPLDRLANIAISVRKYVQHELLEKRVAPELEPIDLLADIIVSIDYYLECLKQDASFNLAFLIDKAEEKCATIGYPAEVPNFESPIAASAEISEDERAAIAVDIEPETPVESAPEALVEVEAETESASEAVATEQTSSPYVDDDFQDELMATFLEEAEDLLNEISTTLTSWRNEPDDFSHAESLHRALHTIKGGARLSGMEALGSAAHDFESYSLDHQVARNANTEFFDQSMARYDSLMGMVEKARSGELIEELTGANAPTDTIEPESVIITPIVEPPAPTPKEADVFDEALASGSEPETSASAAPISSLEGAFKIQEQEKSDTTEPLRETADNRAEVVRLSASDLDEIINLSGESTVFRTRVEAEVTNLNNTIGELENTIDRIQMLARRLDVETQAQIVFRKEKIAEAEFPKDFDPLEMDRYSMLQQLSRQLNESASDLRDLRGTLSSNNSDTLSLLTQTSRLQSELNDRLIRTRMVPFGRLIPRLQRMTRQIATELEKKVQLHTGVLEGELDRNVLNQILPALEHVLRNAIDHGIETNEERLELNKDPAGRIRLEVQRDGAQVVIKIADDGRGINLDKVKQRALANGFIDANQAATMQDAEIADLIFMPGFSTAESLTKISGRGVGMDIVRSIVSQLGGKVEVGSKSGVGSTFFLRIPFTLSVNRALMISIEDNNYALPLSSLEALARVSKEELDSYYEEDDKYLSYGNHKYRVMYLGEILKIATRPPTDSLTNRTVPLALFRSGEYSVAAQVDEIYGSQEIVVKSLGHPFSNIPGVSGAAIMGDGTVLVTLDMFTLMSKTDHSSLGRQPQIENRGLVEEEKTEILVVDDSVTIRKVTTRFLKREGFAVTLARDGVEALQMINEHIPDLIILDVEMPNMDGFELISILRSNERFEDIPVILITSRTGEKHRQRGLELGAQRYFGKPYREDEIMLAIGELTGSQGSEN